MKHDANEPLSRQPTRTFQPRRRPLSLQRAELLERLEPLWCLGDTGPRVDWRDVFGRKAAVVLDIGIGLGDTMISMARSQPEVDVVGVDVHTPGIASSLAAIEEGGLHNVRLVHGDGLRFLDRIPMASLGGVRIFFPDPWPKARHRHRRLVSRSNVDRLVERLADGGWLHFATDIDNYAVQIERVCSADGRLAGGRIDRPVSRPITRYEQKGIDAGRSSVDLHFVRRSAEAMEF